MNIGNVSVNALNSAPAGSLQQGVAASMTTKSLEIQEEMVNKLINGSTEGINNAQTEAFNAMGKGLNINTVA